MRKIIVSEMISIDGFFAGPNGEIDWHNVDEEFNSIAIDLLKKVDTVLLGRVTYDLFVNFWPSALTDPRTSKNNLTIAKRLNDATKIVFSRSMSGAKWNNTVVMKDLSSGEIARLKNSTGKDIVVYGSGIIVSELSRAGLIDELRLFVNPVVLGAGKLLLTDQGGRLHLKLLRTKTFRNGNVMLSYEPERK